MFLPCIYPHFFALFVAGPSGELTTISKTSKGHRSTTATDRTRTQRTQCDTLTMQTMVSSLCWKQCAARAAQTTAQHKRQANYLSYNVTLRALKAYMTNKSYQYLHQLTWKQAWVWPQWYRTSKDSSHTWHTCLQTFLTERGRTQAILAPTVLQSDQEEYLGSLLESNLTLGSNISVRQSPAYSSQSQGSIERFHRTLFNQVRTLTAQLKNFFKLNIISTNHPTMPWAIRHATYLLDRYAIHNGGNTSYSRRWNTEHKTPLRDFGEMVQYMIPQHKRMPKPESRF